MKFLNHPVGFLILIICPLIVFLAFEIRNFIAALKSSEDEEEIVQEEN